MELPKALVESLERHRIRKWEVYHVPLSVMTYSPMDAESLTRNPNYLHAVRDGSIVRNNDIARLLEALRQARVTPVREKENVRYDIRWGTCFLDAKGGRVFTLFLDGRRKNAAINGRNYEISGEIGEWFSEFTRRCFEPERQ